MRIGLSQKILGFLFFSLVLVAGTLSVFNRYASRKIGYHRFEDRAEAIAAILNQALEGFAENGDWNSVQRMILHASSTPEVAHIGVVGKDLKVLADSRLSRGSEIDYDKKIISEVLKSNVPSMSYGRSSKGEGLLILARPLRLKENEGASILCLEMSTVPLDRELSVYAQTADRIIIVTSSLVIGLLYFLSRHFFVVPLRNLKRAAEQISTGRLDAKVAVETNDELGDLAERFNQMTDNLQTTMVSKRVLEDANQKLVENQAQLVESEKLAGLGLMAAGIAHEINNPIGFILSNLETFTEYIRICKSLTVPLEELAEAVRREDQGHQKKILQRLDKLQKAESLMEILQDSDSLLSESWDGARRVKEIVQNLKSFARVDEPEMIQGDVNQMLEETLHLVWNELKYKCEVQKSLHPLPTILCYPGKLKQVFMNLLVNAAQAIPEKGTVTVETRKTPKDVIIRIEDTGEGIPPENLPKIFTPFFTTKPVGKGTGLGLSIAYGIIQSHKGSIDVKSEVSQGTTFTIRLPLFLL